MNGEYFTLSEIVKFIEDLTVIDEIPEDEIIEESEEVLSSWNSLMT